MAKIQKQDALKLLGNIPDQYVFYVHDRRILRNMDDLKTALETMSDETYAYHSNEQKKDFSNRVKDIIGDEKLARDLNRATNRVQAARSVAAREVFLSSKLNTIPGKGISTSSSRVERQ